MYMLDVRLPIPCAFINIDFFMFANVQLLGAKTVSRFIRGGKSGIEQPYELRFLYKSLDRIMECMENINFDKNIHERKYDRCIEIILWNR